MQACEPLHTWRPTRSKQRTRSGWPRSTESERLGCALSCRRHEGGTEREGKGKQEQQECGEKYYGHRFNTLTRSFGGSWQGTKAAVWVRAGGCEIGEKEESGEPA